MQLWHGIPLLQLWKEKMTEIEKKIIEEIKKIYDPEIPINIYKKAFIEMTLTTPNCPVAESLPNMVKDNIMKVNGVRDVDLKLVWDPPWSKDKMSEAAKLELNL